MHPRRTFLATESLAAQNSGIARVARLMARVFADLVDGDGFRCTGVSLSDQCDQPLDWSWVRPCQGRRLEYVSRVQTAALRSCWFFYDSLSMARAHFMGPARIRPALAWMHGIDVWEGARPVHLRVARSVDLLVTNSAYTRQRASALHPGLDRARVCWLGTETDEPVPKRPRSRDAEPSVLLLARMDPVSYKGHKELIELWPTIVRQVPTARLVIAGDGPGRRPLQELMKHSPVSSQIELTGYVEEGVIPKLWSRASVFAMPSRGEGFGLVYIEAMRQGIPVIASRQDAGQEINIHGETGFNIDIAQPAELADTLITLLRDPGKAQAMGENGRERWRRHFTWTAFKSRFAGILEEARILNPARQSQ
jgi:phosphatidylinositol alpha-1,6-mannosyltransferase